MRKKIEGLGFDIPAQPIAKASKVFKRCRHGRVVGTALALCTSNGALGNHGCISIFTSLVERLRFGAERIDRLVRLCGGDVDMGGQHSQHCDEEKRTLANDQSHWRLLFFFKQKTAYEMPK